jgi:hypothetical protein
MDKRVGKIEKGREILEAGIDLNNHDKIFK